MLAVAGRGINWGDCLGLLADLAAGLSEG